MIKGSHLSEEAKRKISLSLIGNKYNLGHHHSEESRKKMSEAHKGNKYSLGNILSEETKRKISESLKGRPSHWKGKHLSEEHKKKIRETMKGKIFSEEHKERISKAIKGRVFSEEWKNKLRISNKGKQSGSKNANWKGGISFLPYPVAFNRELKELIRQRDGYQCQLCGMPECENISKLDVHHIDHNKENCLPSNLIALCRSCNVKANYNRKQWIKHFKEKLNV